MFRILAVLPLLLAFAEPARGALENPAAPASSSVTAQDPPAGDTSGPASSETEGDVAQEPAKPSKELWERLRDDPGATLKYLVRTEGPPFLGKLILFLILLVLARVIANIIARLLRKALDIPAVQGGDLLENFLVNTTRNVLFLFGILFALSTVGVSVGPFLAGVGVMGFVIGFALQDTLANFAAGLMILLYRPYDVGDFVDAGGVKGTVKDMTLVSTTFGTGDNQRIVVPNGQIWGGTITNVTVMPTRRVDLTASIGYDDDIELAERVLARLCNEHPKVHADPEPVIRLNALAASSVDFVVRVWADTGDYWAVHWDLTRSIKLEFDKAGLSIPYPQQDVHLHRVSAS